MICAPNQCSEHHSVARLHSLVVRRRSENSGADNSQNSREIGLESRICVSKRHLSDTWWMSQTGGCVSKRQLVPVAVPGRVQLKYLVRSTWWMCVQEAYT
jgi:hypothetical protein